MITRRSFLRAGLLFVPAVGLGASPLAVRRSNVSSKYITNGLVAWWKCDEGTGTLLGDSSGQGNELTSTSSTWLPGKIGSAISFNGTEYALRSGAVVVSAPFSMCAWVNYTSITANIIAITKQVTATREGHRLLFITNQLYAQSFSIALGGGSGQSAHPTVLSAGTWYHVAGVFASATSRVAFVNGISAAENTTNITTPGVDTTQLASCYESGVNGGLLTGMIDDARIYNRALTTEEIAKISTLNG